MMIWFWITNFDVFYFSICKIYRKESLDIIYSLIDNEIRVARLPVTSIRFFNKPNDTNQDHYQILVASCKRISIKFKT
jgi:hypothetical protein